MTEKPTERSVVSNETLDRAIEGLTWYEDRITKRAWHGMRRNFDAGIAALAWYVDRITERT